jgi:hypothetical protein
MGRRHYVAMTESISRMVFPSEGERLVFVERVADMLESAAKDTDSRFDRERFLKACFPLS